MTGLNYLIKTVSVVILLSVFFCSCALCEEKVYDKYALINSKGQLITGFEWDDISFSDGYIKVFKGKINGIGTPEDGKYGLLDNTGRTILDVEWDGLTEVNSKTIGICKNGKWGCFDIEKNQVIIPLEYEYISPFSGNYAVACLDKKSNNYYDKRVFYFINRDNEVVYEGKFGSAFVYEDGIALVEDYVDVDGYNREQRISAYKNRKYHWININTKQVYPHESGLMFNNNEGILTAYENGKYGCMNLAGELIIPCEYDTRLIFENDRAVGKKNGQYFIINKKNEIVSALEFDYVSEIHNGRTYGFIGKVKEGEIPKTGQYCILDSNGQRLGPLRELDSVEEPENGVWWVEKGGLYTIIDMTGNYVTNSVWKDIMWPTTSSGLKAVSDGNAYGIVDGRGNVIIDYVWDSIIYDKDDLFAVKRFQNNHDVLNADWGISKNAFMQNEGEYILHESTDEYECLTYYRNLYGFDWAAYYYFVDDALCYVTIAKINRDGITAINDLEKLDKLFEEEYGKASFMVGTATADQIDLLLKKADPQKYEMYPLFSRGYLGRNANIALSTYLDRRDIITAVTYQEYYSDHSFKPLSAYDLTALPLASTFLEINPDTLLELSTDNETPTNEKHTIAIITKDKVNVRKNASSNSDKIGVVNRDQSFDVIEEVTNNKGEKWYHIRLDVNKTGYVSAQYATVITDSNNSNKTASLQGKYSDQNYTLKRIKNTNGYIYVPNGGVEKDSSSSIAYEYGYGATKKILLCTSSDQTELLIYDPNKAIAKVLLHESGYQAIMSAVSNTVYEYTEEQLSYDDIAYIRICKMEGINFYYFCKMIDNDFVVLVYTSPTDAENEFRKIISPMNTYKEVEKVKITKEEAERRKKSMQNLGL